MEFLKQGKKQARTYYNFTHAKNVKNKTKPKESLITGNTLFS